MLYKNLVIILFFVVLPCVYSQETGLNQINNFDELPILRNDILNLQQSSHDPTGGNDDGFSKGNFPGTINGENIMLHAKGKGIINRIWLTGYDYDDKIKIYFDGEMSASVDETVNTFFSGTNTPFLFPLVVDEDSTSGGFLSYMPFPFEQEVLITTTGDRFYNINYQIYDNKEDINTWTGDEDLSVTYDIFNNRGKDPRGDQDYTSLSSVFNLPAGETKTAVVINKYNQSVSNLFITIPSVEFKDLSSRIITDDGNATVGYSQFDLTIDPDASNVRLIRRLDYWVKDQKADVYVDGVYAGEWFTEGGDGVYRWRDAEFEIPVALTKGKSKISVKVQFISSMIDWNEFYYWVFCDDILTDELDVANTLSETEHNYYIEPKNWTGVLSTEYPEEPDNSGPTLLSKINIQIFYDGESIPSVDVPLSMFFGGGSIENNRFQSLPVGVLNRSNTMYSYFPMPFKNSFELKLINKSDVFIDSIQVDVNYKDFNFDPESTGYFKAQYNQEDPPVSGKDFIILNATGRGKYIGMVLEARNTEGSLWLEGDERFYIDGCRTPVSYGTGTEDYFNGAWYFNRGPFDLATHGLTAVQGSDRSMYRFHLSDPVYFNNEAVFGIEHGPVNDIFADFRAVAFYYLNNNSGFTLVDEIDISDPQSENEHNYTVTGENTSAVDCSYQFEGDDDNVTIVESGRYIDGMSQFTVKVEPGKVLKIKRMFDYYWADQCAKVYVDNQFVGRWFTNGSNEIKRWREEFFIIPSRYTLGKDSVTLKFETDFAFEGYKWSEFHYWVYAFKDTNLGIKRKGYNQFNVFPNPAKEVLNFNYEGLDVKMISVVDMKGRVVMNINKNARSVDVSSLKAGVYLLNIITKNRVLSSRFIKKNL